MKTALLPLLVLLANCSAKPLPSDTIHITTSEQSFRGIRFGQPPSDFPGAVQQPPAGYGTDLPEVTSYTLPAGSILPLAQGPGRVTLVFFRRQLARLVLHTSTRAERQTLLAELGRAYGAPASGTDSFAVGQNWASPTFQVSFVPDPNSAQADAWLVSDKLYWQEDALRLRH